MVRAAKSAKTSTSKLKPPAKVTKPGKGGKAGDEQKVEVEEPSELNTVVENVDDIEIDVGTAEDVKPNFGAITVEEVPSTTAATTSETSKTTAPTSFPCLLGCPATVVYSLVQARRLHYMAMHRILAMEDLDSLEVDKAVGQTEMSDAELESFCWLLWCSTCGMQTLTFAERAAHKGCGDGENVGNESMGKISNKFWCQFCTPQTSDTSFTRRDERDRHLRKEHKLTLKDIALLDRSCSVCARLSRTKQGAAEHTKLHVPTMRPLECDLGCVHQYYMSKTAVFEHYGAQHGNIPQSQYHSIKCPVCLRTFACERALYKHAEQHRYDGRPCKCVMGCRQANFVTQVGLDMHYSRLHHKQKVSVLRTRIVHRCSICQEQQPSIATLTEHMRCHNPSLAHQCEQCTRTYFKTVDELATHMEERHGVKREMETVEVQQPSESSSSAQQGEGDKETHDGKEEVDVTAV